MNIHELQTHKWVIDIEENKKLPQEERGYLMVREVSPMRAAALAGDFANADQGLQMDANKKIFKECIVSIHNVKGTDSDGQEYDITSVEDFMDVIGTRIFQSLTQFIMDPVGEKQRKN